MRRSRNIVRAEINKKQWRRPKYPERTETRVFQQVCDSSVNTGMIFHCDPPISEIQSTFYNSWFCHASPSSLLLPPRTGVLIWKSLHPSRYLFAKQNRVWVWPCTYSMMLNVCLNNLKNKIALHNCILTCFLLLTMPQPSDLICRMLTGVEEHRFCFVVTLDSSNWDCFIQSEHS